MSDGGDRDTTRSGVDPDPVSVPDEDDEDRWRFSLDEVGPDGVRTEDRHRHPDPGDPTLENVAFVLLGVATTVAAVALALGLF